MKRTKLARAIAFAFVSIASAVFFVPQFTFAAFSISVRPFEGGNDLRFGKASNTSPYTSKELIVSVTTDLAKQYQIIQSFIEPLTNDQGVSIPQNNIFVYGLKGSNRFGTLLVEQEIPASISRTIIYTSDAQGQADSFNLAYVLKPPFNAPSGSYRGRIAFILEPLDTTQQPVTLILNVFAEIQVGASIDLKTPAGTNFIRLNSARQDAYASDLIADIRGSIGSQFRILQSLTQPLVSLEGQQLSADALKFQISGAKKGTGPSSPTPLSLRQDVVYSSGLRGEADSFVITYSLYEPQNQKAGKYRTGIRYDIEGTAFQELLSQFDLEVEIARVFDLIITPELGGTIMFRDVKLQQPPKQSQVVIEVKSNIGKQYQVSQQMLSSLANKEGRTVPSKYFTLKQESLETKGRLPFSSPVEVKTAEMVLFISDKEGSADKFKVIYELTPSVEIIAGDYSTRFTYSISEI